MDTPVELRVRSTYEVRQSGTRGEVRSSPQRDVEMWLMMGSDLMPGDRDAELGLRPHDPANAHGPSVRRTRRRLDKCL